jgi:hypothetical protein
MSTFLMAHDNMVEAVEVGNKIQENLAREASNFNPDTFNATGDILPKLIPIQNIIPYEVGYFLPLLIRWLPYIDRRRDQAR